MKRAVQLSMLLLLTACVQVPVERGKDAVALESVNPRARVHTELGAQYHARRQYSIALQELREALLADQTYAPAYNTLGLVHAALLEDKEAEANFRRALELAPEYSEAHNNYGHYLCARQRGAEAMTHFETAWRNPLYATPERALANASHCALRQGDNEGAERLAQRALVRAGNQPQALLTMAEIQFRRGQLTQARSMIQQLESLGRLEAGAVWLALRLERALGNREAEAAYGLQLRRHHPEATETSWLLSSQYEMPGGKP